MSVLVTGASGFVGSALIPFLIEKGHRVYGLSRHPPIGSRKLVPLIGDILQPDLDLSEVPEDIAAVYHLAGIHSLRQEDKEGLIWKTNVVGTKNVLEFCLKHNIRKLIFTSTAYTWPVNPYGLSKIENESAITEFAKEHNIEVAILKLSIVMGTAENPYPGHFSRFISALIQTHRRAELVRRKIEGSLRLPVIEPLFRIGGNPEGKLNLIQINQVAKGIADIKEAGTFWLTHPDPPTLQQLADWISEVIMVKLKFEPEFKPTPIEAGFQKMTAAFQPYLQGDNFKSDLKKCPSITKEFITSTIKRTVLD